MIVVTSTQSHPVLCHRCPNIPCISLKRNNASSVSEEVWWTGHTVHATYWIERKARTMFEKVCNWVQRLLCTSVPASKLQLHTVWRRQHWLTECRCTLWQMYRQHAASAGLSGPGAFPAPRLLLLSSTQAKARHINESILLPIWATVEWRPPWVTLIAPPTNTFNHNGPASTALISYHCRFLTQDKRRDRSMSSKSGV